MNRKTIMPIFLGVIIVSLLFLEIRSNQPIIVQAGQVPPGIPDTGTYAIAEGRIIGSLVNIAYIADSKGVTLADDYVQYDAYEGKARVYYDNTIQYIYSSTFEDVANRISEYYYDPTYFPSNYHGVLLRLQHIFYNLINEGLIDASSILENPSDIYVKGNIFGWWTRIKLTLFRPRNNMLNARYNISIKITDMKPHHFTTWFTSGHHWGVDIFYNNEMIYNIENTDHFFLNKYLYQLPESDDFALNYTCAYKEGNINYDYYDDIILIIYTQEKPIPSIQLSDNINGYDCISYDIVQWHCDSPGTGLSLKSVYPGTATPNSLIDVQVKFNTPNSTNADYKDYYPSAFSLYNNKVTVERYHYNSPSDLQLDGSTQLTVSPSSSGGNSFFLVNNEDASGLLDDLDYQTLIKVKYQLVTPGTGGTTYTLPAAEITYTPRN